MTPHETASGCCCTYRTKTKIIGYFGAIFHSIATLGTIACLVAANILQDEYEKRLDNESLMNSFGGATYTYRVDNHAYRSEPSPAETQNILFHIGFKVIGAVLGIKLVASILSVIFFIVLLIGAHQNNKTCINAWKIYFYIISSLEGILLVVICMFSFVVRDIAFISFSVLITLCYIGFVVLFGWTVSRFSKELNTGAPYEMLIM